MIRKPEVLRDYVRMNPLSQVQFGTNTIGSLTANPTVFEPANWPVPAAELNTACTTLATKYNEYKQAGKSKKEAFLVAQAIWVVKFNLMADYVEFVAATSGQDAGAIIQLSGFRITKTETEPAVIPVEPESEVAIGTVKGKVEVNSKAVKGAKGFCFAVMTPDVQMTQVGNQITLKIGNAFASFIIGTDREVSFEGLPSYFDAKVIAAAFNTAGMSNTEVQTVTIP